MVELLCLIGMVYVPVPLAHKAMKGECNAL